MRKFGIPTVVCRLIRKAVHQVLSPLFDPDFSETSDGFRAETLYMKTRSMGFHDVRNHGG
ncbi:MAG: hypothetical protein MUO68_09370 [Desulfobacteraceae bacterium]|nr:hypothetical protein [Desulfobacteraceae bacterium]